ncbi:MAG: pyrimidine-nucleoside phosphorylase, partial [Bacillota bacterium]|nr:pyrimidine-nucleoside phosphorylase [Bacillota bacterium]
RPVAAQREGYLASVAAEELGRAAVLLGAGRARKEDPVDPGVGLIVHVQIGERVERGAPLATLYARTQAQADEAEPLVRAAFQVGDAPAPAPPLVYRILR